MSSSVPNEESVVVGHPVLQPCWVIRDRLLHASWWQQTLTIAIGAIVYIYCAGWLGATWLTWLRGWGSGVPSLPDIAPNSLPWLFVRWDSGYYWGIATNGYLPDGSGRAYFPLYPLVIRALSTLLGTTIVWSGLLVSVLSFLSAGLMIYKWVRLDYGHQDAIWTTASMCVFPMAFYFVSFYAEPLFIFLGILSLYFARQGQFGASGITIALAGAAAPHAVSLGIPYVLEFWQQRDFTRARWLGFAFGLSIAPTGMLAYSIFLAQLNGGNLIQPYINLLQEEWKTYITWPWMTLGDGLNAAILGTNISPDWFSRAYAIHDLLYALLGLTLSVWSFRQLRVSIAAYLLVGIIYFYLIHGPYGYAFDSMPRRVASLAPIYLVIALLLNQLPTRWRWIIWGLLVFLLGIFSAWFVSGRWVS